MKAHQTGLSTSLVALSPPPMLCRKTLERFKWVLFVSVPVWFGYGFARDPANLEWVKRVVRASRGDMYQLQR